MAIDINLALSAGHQPSGARWFRKQRTVNPLLDDRICDPPEGDEDQPSHSMVEPLLLLRPSQGR
jgi:hypothetical protein